ncbi:MAG: ribonucleoside-diphosphate reductase alpha chain, partial [Gaiellaceae bacterium]|nr:ribonucleoside-diphosphate reductase alpha chain [Gaiellaceae bacterium]
MASAQDLSTAAPASDDYANAIVDEASNLGVDRVFTIPGRDPFDEIDWETRDAFIPGKDKPAFEQKNVEFPKFWSQTATNIV